jgi:hypothetical protein
MRGTFCILVIEEDPGLRELFSVLLEKYFAFFPETPGEAQRLLTDVPYDLLILDEDNGTLERRWGVRRGALGPTLLIAPARPVDPRAPNASPLLVLPKPFAVDVLLHFVETIHTTWAAP